VTAELYICKAERRLRSEEGSRFIGSGIIPTSESRKVQRKKQGREGHIITHRKIFLKGRAAFKKKEGVR